MGCRCKEKYGRAQSYEHSQPWCKKVEQRREMKVFKQAGLKILRTILKLMSLEESVRLERFQQSRGGTMRRCLATWVRFDNTMRALQESGYGVQLRTHLH